MNYQRYKYTEEDISTLIELATRNNKPCVQVYREGEGVWPFSENVLNGFLVGRRPAKTERLQVAIMAYKTAYSRYARYSTLSEKNIIEVVSLRKEGTALADISKEMGLKKSLVAYIVSGNMKHPAAPKEKIVAAAKRGRKKTSQPKPNKPPKPIKVNRLTNAGLINALTNALGPQHFDPNQVIEVLTKEADRIRQEGGNPGSLIALANLLPEITEEAKKRY